MPEPLDTAVTVTGAEDEPEPFVFEQVRVNVVVWVSAPVVAPEPLTAFVPDQLLFAGLAEAVHDVAFEEVQLNAEDPPFDTEVGLAVSETVGTGAVVWGVMVMGYVLLHPFMKSQIWIHPA